MQDKITEDEKRIIEGENPWEDDEEPTVILFMRDKDREVASPSAAAETPLPGERGFQNLNAFRQQMVEEGLYPRKLAEEAIRPDSQEPAAGTEGISLKAGSLKKEDLKKEDLKKEGPITDERKAGRLIKDGPLSEKDASEEVEHGRPASRAPEQEPREEPAQKEAKEEKTQEVKGVGSFFIVLLLILALMAGAAAYGQRDRWMKEPPSEETQADQP